MNLQKLFNMQKQLDDHIMDEHPELKGQDNLDWKILALQVELGECANEWRGFKKWSNDQEPRGQGTYLEYGCKCEGVGNRWVKKNPLLEEYVDCLHFILSIGNDLGYNDITEEWVSEQGDYSEETTTDTFILLLEHAADVYTYEKAYRQYMYETLFLAFIALGLDERHLGFTWQQIEKAYLDKNEVNHKRQNTGY
ncbi:hypothetical protein CAI16_05335 [Virgibacillus dokdonensis]|uniref:dUTPase n=1 Tax=Virgibacillus dokdonensis TaxID=302167 RepID=A0A3E0WW39_9BACI|nr:dUTP diphosphatase [Virgibacillus dokdonensis]RFA36216.1 hypothetical protein CAI16_05335 [Virgibacillus dokdonensis]